MNKVASKLNKKSVLQSKSKKLKIKVKAPAKSKKKSSTLIHKSKAKVHKASKKIQEKELIVIDESQGLIFENDKTLFGFFAPQIQYVEKKYLDNYKAEEDFNEEELISLDHWLEATLDDPDEIWVDQETFKDVPMYTLIKNFEYDGQIYEYISVVYLNTEDKYPSFVFIHFATKSHELSALFREKEIIYHRKLEAIQFAAIEGDSLLEGDYLAIGLLESMLKLRNEKDIPTDKFKEFGKYRSDTINQPDEIWKKVDTEGNTLVTFIKDLSDDMPGENYYVVVTEEDEDSEVHSLLFSFPTNDDSLVDRYRQGENLEAEEVSTESAH